MKADSEFDPRDILPVRLPGATIYALRGRDGLYLIDTGLIFARHLLDRALTRRGWRDLPLRGILLTHGHLDHTRNARALATASRAWIALPRLDLAHYYGRFAYRGAARVCGLLEAAGRVLLGFRVRDPDRLIDDSDTFDLLGGLRALHLPGHTPGHTGFYCPSGRLLFCGDLFASYGPWAWRPPSILNSAPAQLDASLAKALALELEGVLPSHGDNASPAEHLRRLRILAKRVLPDSARKLNAPH